MNDTTSYIEQQRRLDAADARAAAERYAEYVPTGREAEPSWQPVEIQPGMFDCTGTKKAEAA